MPLTPPEMSTGYVAITEESVLCTIGGLGKHVLIFLNPIMSESSLQLFGKYRAADLKLDFATPDYQFWICP